MAKITIAIDGYSSCGKSTLAKAIARELGYIFIDTGAMYRAVTLFAFRKGFVSKEHLDKEQIIASLSDLDIHFEFNDVSGKLEITVNGENVEPEIRSLQISQLVSKVAAIKEVRRKMVSEQQKIGKDGGVVMDGRDIGSVVFPNAELKFFITAKPEIRAERRFKELNDASITFDEVLENLKQRDHIDSTREEGPLLQTADAVVIDNSDLNQEEQFLLAMDIIQKKVELLLNH